MWGTVSVGGVELREELLAEQSGGGLKITGQESHPPSTRAHVEAVHHNLTAMVGLIVPVVFGDKTNLTGFYRVESAESQLFRFANGAVGSATWALGLARLGSERDLEVESRVPEIARQTAHATTPVVWHAPAAGAATYLTGSTVPSGYVDRTSADGVIRVHTGLPSSPPRWTATASGFLDGCARLLFDGARRLGLVTPPLAVWEADNGLVRVSSGAAGGFTVWCWDGGDWASAAEWTVSANGAPLTGQPEVTILRNDPEQVQLRLTYPANPGRVTIDLGIRRGSRYVTGVVKRHTAATIALALATPAAGTAETGGVLASAADPDGNRWLIGSASAVTADTANGGISKTATARLDFFAGHEVGDPPAAGDAYNDLLAQYLGDVGTSDRIVAR